MCVCRPVARRVAKLCPMREVRIPFSISELGLHCLRQTGNVGVALNILTPGRYCAFVVDLGNYGRNKITPRLIFEGLRKTPSDDFTFTHYHWRRSGNFLLQAHSATAASAVEAKISNAINRVSSVKLNHSFSSIFRDLGTLQALMQYAREKTGVAPGHLMLSRTEGRSKWRLFLLSQVAT